MKRYWPMLLWIAAAGWAWWWLSINPLPDGYQNEYLHIGNAYDLWEALLDRDLWHLRWYMYTGYWPWGFYAAPWPLMALLGAGRVALVATNLVHLAVLLWAMSALGRSLGARLAPALVVLCPGVFGSLVRFEPNLADIAWTAAGLAMLVRSQGLRKRWAVLGWGVCLGVGLMMDRLTVLFFLLPAIVPLLIPLPRSRRTWASLILAGLSCVVLSGAYYREFVSRHTAELLSQAPVGEIDSAGAVHGIGGVMNVLYYPLVLLDSQAGAIIGLLMLWGAGIAGLEVWRSGRQRAWVGQARCHAILLAATLPAVAFFTLIAKKQVYYTLPILAPLSVLAGQRGRWAWLGVAGGLWSFAAVGVGSVPGGPWMPISWVSPRHLLARPPTQQRWPLAEGLAAIAPEAEEILVFSEDPTLFEGFVALAVREALPGRIVRGVTLDPVGCFEFLDDFDSFVWIGPPGGAWPSKGRVRAELLTDHYDLQDLPPLGERLEAAQPRFVEQGRWPAGERELVVFGRVEQR